MNCVQDSCVVCQILHVSFIFAKARRHMPQTWRDTSRYERLVVFSSFFMGLRLELYGAQYSLSVTRRPPLGTRCCHQQYCSHKTAEVVVCICMHCGHTHSTLQGAAPVMLCFFIHSLSECTILDTIDPFGLSHAWKHTVTCALVAMSVFIGALLS